MADPAYPSLDALEAGDERVESPDDGGVGGVEGEGAGEAVEVEGEDRGPGAEGEVGELEGGLVRERFREELCAIPSGSAASFTGHGERGVLTVAALASGLEEDDDLVPNVV